MSVLNDCKISFIFGFFLFVGISAVGLRAHGQTQQVPRSLNTISSTRDFVNTLNNGTSQNTRGEVVQTVVNTAIDYQRSTPTQFWTGFVNELRDSSVNSLESCLAGNKKFFNANNINNYIYLCTVTAMNLGE